MRNADHLCELLSPIDPGEAMGYVEDSRYLMQRKHDGVRLIVERYMGGLFAFDREGRITAIDPLLFPELEAFGEDFMLDGELLNQGTAMVRLVVWDLLRIDEQDLRSLPYDDRLRALEACGIDEDGVHLSLSETWHAEVDKKRELLGLYESGAEGAVFKDRLAIWQPGRAGQHYKLKFWNSCTCRVADKSARADARQDKYSVAIELLGAGNGNRVPCGPASCEPAYVAMGFCGIPKSEALPQVGALIEVRYLYAQPDGLYQPVYLGRRTDLSVADSIEQLKWKQEEERNHA